jgi:hypothetical protein
VSGRSFPVGMSDVSGAMQLTLTLNVEGPTDVRKLDLSLALGDVFFLHIPPDSNPRRPPRSIYFMVESSSTARVGLDTRRWVSSPLFEVAKPKPMIVGRTMVWGTVFQQFASWESLINANPTWGDLLANVSSPEDLVVM